MRNDLLSRRNKSRLVLFVKHNRIFYYIYYAMMSLLILIFRVFVPIRNNRVLFVCSGGRTIGCNVKPLFKMMLNDATFKDNKFYVALNETSNFNHMDRRVHAIRINSLRYYLIAMSCRLWITNVAIERGLRFKRKNNFYFNTWHSVHIKTLAHDISSSHVFSPVKQPEPDILCAVGDYDKDIKSKAFRIPSSRVVITGHPRNDCLTNGSLDYDDIKFRLGIDVNDTRRIILYAPTHRDNIEHISNAMSQVNGLDLDSIKTALEENYIFLLRLHPSIANTTSLPDDEFFLNVSSYESFEELMYISDVLVSDYSGAFFDFCILKRPMICFAYDLVDYQKRRGLYVEVEEFFNFPIAYSEADLIDSIRRVMAVDLFEPTIEFLNRHIDVRSESTKMCINLIKSRLSL